MKKTYMIPVSQVLNLSFEDIIRTSGVERVEAVFDVNKEDSMHVSDLFD